MINQNAKKIKIITAITVAVLFLLAVILVVQFISINALKAKEKQLALQLDKLETDIYTYSQENKYLSSSKHYEDYAREVLDWGKDGEIRFTK